MGLLLNRTALDWHVSAKNQRCYREWRVWWSLCHPPTFGPARAARVGRGGAHDGLLAGGVLGPPSGDLGWTGGVGVSWARGRALPPGRSLPVLASAGGRDADPAGHESGRRGGPGPRRAGRGVLPAAGRGWEVLLRPLPGGAASRAWFAHLLTGLRSSGGGGCVQAPGRAPADARRAM